MNYTLTPSLKHRCLTTIAIAVWNEHNLKHSALKLRFVSNPSEEWLKIEDKAKELLLPEGLKKELLYTINAVGFQVLTWIQFHSHFLAVSSSLEPKIKFHWTPQAAIDKKKTAEALVQDESIDLFIRFRFACAYCLEDCIPVLWNQLDRVRKHEIKNHKRFLLLKSDEGYLIQECMTIRKYEKRLLVFWSYIMDEDISYLDTQMRIHLQDDVITPYRYAFECAACGGNEVATNYFLQKLTDEEKQRILVRVAIDVTKLANEYMNEQWLFPKAYYTGVLCLLLSAMNEEQQIQVFQKHPDYVLYCLLEWPWQGFFISTAQQMWSFLPGYDYLNLLQHIIFEKIFSGYRDFNYRMLFGMFWLLSPNGLKKFVLELFARRLLLDLFRIKDEENSMLILKDLAQQEKNSCCSRDICQILIKEEKWNLLQFFLRECESSEEGQVRLDEVLKKIFSNSEDNLSHQLDLDEIFKLVEECIMSVPKRKYFGDSWQTAKKMCP